MIAEKAADLIRGRVATPAPVAGRLASTAGRAARKATVAAV
jgi:choline dehydrogenase